MNPDDLYDQGFVEDPPKPPPPHISFSQWSMYQRCSLQYYDRYVLGWIDPPKLATSMGHAGHAALEANARRKIRTGADMPLPEILQSVSDNFDNETALIPADQIEPDEDVGKSKDHLVNSLTVYRLIDAPNVLPAVVEWQFNVDLTDPEYEFPIRVANGRIDLIDARENVEDYKFVMQRRPKTQPEVDMSPQLSLYDLVYRRTFGRSPASLAFRTFLPPGTNAVSTPAESRRVARSPELLTPEARSARDSRTIHQLHTTERAIKAGIFMPTDNPIVCSWCGYRKKCQSSLVRDDYLAMEIRARTQITPIKEDA